MTDTRPPGDDFAFEDDPPPPQDRTAEREELRRHEAEREARRVRRDTASRKAVAWIVAVALAFLLYDSAGSLTRALSRDTPWTTHAVLAGLSALGLLALLVAGLRTLLRR